MPAKRARDHKIIRAKEEIIALAFEGRWTQAEIANRCGVSARSVWAVLNDPATLERLEKMRNDLGTTLRNVAYAHKTQRIVGLSQMAEHARREYEARPLLKEIRPTADGEIVNEAFNRDAHEAFRKNLDDIAKELGERTNKDAATAQVLIVAIGHDLLEAV